MSLVETFMKSWGTLHAFQEPHFPQEAQLHFGFVFFLNLSYYQSSSQLRFRKQLKSCGVWTLFVGNCFKQLWPLWVCAHHWRCFDVVVSARGWECTKDRCGEVRNEENACHCSEDCLARGDCCTNYQVICKGTNFFWTDWRFQRTSTDHAAQGSVADGAPWMWVWEEENVGCVNVSYCFFSFATLHFIDLK